MAHNTVTLDQPGSEIQAEIANSPLRVSYGKLMMWFFLLSDAFTFSALLVTYGLIRYSHPAYDPEIHGAVFQFSTTYCSWRKCDASITI